MSRLVPEPQAPPTMSLLGDPLSQAEKFVAEIWVDTALWNQMSSARVPTKNDFGPRAIKYGGWFSSCSEHSFVCVNDLSAKNRGAMCVFDCTKERARGGRFSAEEVKKWIKNPAYKRTDKTYHPNIELTIQQAKNIEANFIDDAQSRNQPVQSYQVDQGTWLEFIDQSTDDFIVEQPPLTMTAISWLPNEEFDNNGKGLDGYPLFIGDEPFELIWSYKDNTQPSAQKMDVFYETKRFGAAIDGASIGLDSSVLPLSIAILVFFQILF